MKKFITVVVILLLIVGVVYFLGEHKDLINQNNENNEMKNVVENKQENKVVENEETNEVVNEAVSNEIENTISSEIFEESPKTSEEKAVSIAKKDWGNANNVEFSVEGMDGNGNYIVAVRDSKTTQALAFYTVNLENETFKKREMN